MYKKIKIEEDKFWEKKTKKFQKFGKFNKR